ncbi:hypothetical protein D3C72_1999860 [compost metagenome]
MAQLVPDEPIDPRIQPAPVDHLERQLGSREAIADAPDERRDLRFFEVHEEPLGQKERRFTGREPECVQEGRIGDGGGAHAVALGFREEARLEGDHRRQVHVHEVHAAVVHAREARIQAAAHADDLTVGRTYQELSDGRVEVPRAQRDVADAQVRDPVG